MQQINARSTQTGEVPSLLAGLPIVNVWYEGKSIGLYRVKQVNERAIVLKHGAISFPVGTLLDVVDFQRLIPNSASPRVSTTVADNNRGGIQLVW
jgi:hypothetical protein